MVGDRAKPVSPSLERLRVQGTELGFYRLGTCRLVSERSGSLMVRCLTGARSEHAWPHTGILAPGGYDGKTQVKESGAGGDRTYDRQDHEETARQAVAAGGPSSAS